MLQFKYLKPLKILLESENYNVAVENAAVELYDAITSYLKKMNVDIARGVPLEIIKMQFNAKLTNCIKRVYGSVNVCGVKEYDVMRNRIKEWYAYLLKITFNNNDHDNEILILEHNIKKIVFESLISCLAHLKESSLKNQENQIQQLKQQLPILEKTEDEVNFEILNQLKEKLDFYQKRLEEKLHKLEERHKNNADEPEKITLLKQTLGENETNDEFSLKSLISEVENKIKNNAKVETVYLQDVANRYDNLIEEKILKPIEKRLHKSTIEVNDINLHQQSVQEDASFLFKMRELKRFISDWIKEKLFKNPTLSTEKTLIVAAKGPMTFLHHKITTNNNVRLEQRLKNLEEGPAFRHKPASAA